MIKNSDVHVVMATFATITTTTTTTIAIAQPQRQSVITKENDIIREVFLKVMNVIFCFTYLSQEEIVRIFYNKFKLIKLYQICHIQGL